MHYLVELYTLEDTMVIFTLIFTSFIRKTLLKVFLVEFFWYQLLNTNLLLEPLIFWYNWVMLKSNNYLFCRIYMLHRGVNVVD